MLLRPLLSSIFLSTSLFAQTPATEVKVEIPISGVAVPELIEFEGAMSELMETYDIGGGLLAIAVEGEVVYQRGFGWTDENRKTPVPEDATWRLASLSKPFTASVIHSLADRGKLSLDDTVFGSDGILDLEPFKGTLDPLLETITISDLLAHEGGWDWKISGDHTYKEIEIAQELGFTKPPTREETVRWILGQPLDLPPGTSFSYSNTGYLILGLVAEKVGEADLIDLVHRLVLAPEGVESDNLFAGKTFREDAGPREPFYDSVGQTTPNVYDPTKTVASSYGGWNHEVRVAQGGMVATADAVIALMEHHRIVGEEVGDTRPGAGAWEDVAIGSLVGSQTEAVEHGSGIDFVVFVNRRDPKGADLVGEIHESLNTILEASDVDWQLLRKRVGEQSRWVYIHGPYIFDPTNGSRAYLDVGEGRIDDPITGEWISFGALQGWVYLSEWPQVYWEKSSNWHTVDTTLDIWAFDYTKSRWSLLGEW